MHTLTHSHIYSFSLSLALTYSLTHSRTHTLTHSLTHSLTHTLTHTHTHTSTRVTNPQDLIQLVAPSSQLQSNKSQLYKSALEKSIITPRQITPRQTPSFNTKNSSIKDMGNTPHTIKTVNARGFDSNTLQQSRHEHTDQSNLQNHLRWANYYYSRPTHGDKLLGKEEKVLEQLRRKIPAVIHFNGEDGKAALRR